MVENNPAFIDELARSPDLIKAGEVFRSADTITVANNNHTLGDSVIGTGFLAAVQQALYQANPRAKLDALFTSNYKDLVANAPIGEIDYRFVEAADKEAEATQFVSETPQDSLHPMLLQLTENREPPATLTALSLGDGSCTVIDKLYGYLLRNFPYSVHGPARYAHAVEDLFQLPSGSIDVAKAQPHLALPENQEEIYKRLMKRSKADASRPQLGVIVEASTPDKRYPLERWEEVIARFSAAHPEYGVNVIMNSNNDEAKRKFSPLKVFGLKVGRKGLEPHLVSGTLEEMMVFLSHMNLVLSNDTGLSHVAAAVPNGPRVVTLYRGQKFPPSIWQSSAKQIPVISYDGFLDSIPPEVVLKEAESAL